MNLDQIRAEVLRFNLPLAGDVTLNPAVDAGVLVSIYISRDASGSRTPSGKTLSQLRDAITRHGGTVEYLLIDQTSHQVEDGVRASLINSFPHIVRNSYVTVTDGVASVWIEKKRDLSTEDREHITAHIKTYAQLFKLRGALLHVMSDFKVATPTEVLRAIRKLSPAGCEAVCHELERRGFSVPSFQWVNHRFDLLRKQGLVVRVLERQYALTSRALHELGTVKNRQSPDITRLLALARRGA